MKVDQDQHTTALHGNSLHELYLSVCNENAVPAEGKLEAALHAYMSSVVVGQAVQTSVLLQVFTRTRQSNLTHLSHLTITADRLSSTTVDALAAYLKCQTHLTHLTLNRVRLGDAGIGKLLLALSNSEMSPITHLSLSGTRMTQRGAQAMSQLLMTPLGALTHLDMSNNGANQAGVAAIEKALSTRRTPLKVDLSGNLVVVEVLNTLTHGVGAAVALIGGALLTRRAHVNGESRALVGSVATFAVSLVTLLTSSAVYHAAFRSPQWSNGLRKLDHCSIFLLIAGSYTPFMVRYAWESSNGRRTLAGVWLCASVGVARSLLGVGGSAGRSSLALVTGWLGLLSWKVIAERMGHAVWFVVAGGVAYSVGIVFYLMGKRRPLMHVVWHFAVMAGGALHFFAVWKFVTAGTDMA